jgi:hypothetical protein
MAPRADERTMLLDEKSQIDTMEPNLYDNDSNIEYNTNPQKHCRIITLWTVVFTIVLTSMIGLCIHSLGSEERSIDISTDNESIHPAITDNDPITPPMTTSATTTTTTTASSSTTSTSNRSTNSKYKKVQGIGFQIYTGGAPAILETNTTDGTPKLNPECIGRKSYGQVVGEVAPMIQCYIGLLDPMLDVRGRIEIMMDAVERAYVLSDNTDSETLKIFIAPEFYWRGITGAYSFEYDELPNDPSFCGPICQILMGLETLVAQKRFEDWIFLFGTIVASDALPTDDPYDFLFYNFAPLYKGYDPEKMDFVGKRFLLPKRYVSSSDFLTPQRHLNESTFKQLLGGQTPGDKTVYNPHDFNQRRYDPTMWMKYKDELNALGYVHKYNKYTFCIFLFCLYSYLTVACLFFVVLPLLLIYFLLSP